MSLEKAITDYIKTNDNVALASSLKQSFNEKLGANPDFQDFAVKMEAYKPADTKE